MLSAVFSFLILSLSVTAAPSAATESVLLLAGAASKPAIEDVARGFEAATGVHIDLSIGGSGMLLSQLKLTRRGDVYFPGSVDFIVRARGMGLVAADTTVVYLVPAVSVPRGNPKGIKTFKDLAKPGVRVVIAHPETVCLGVFAVEMAENLLTPEERAAFRANIATYTDSCEKTATAVALNTCDAAVGWSVFEHWNPERIETIKLAPAEIIRISYLSAAVTTCSANPVLARRLVEYMKSPAGLAAFERFHYFTTPKQALDYAGAERPIGGMPYAVPRAWIDNLPVK